MPPLVGALLKNWQDVSLFEARVHAEGAQPLRNRSAPVTLGACAGSPGCRSALEHEEDLARCRRRRTLEPARHLGARARRHGAYIETAAAPARPSHRCPPSPVLDAASRGDRLSSYHDIVPAVERLEIGYTWYAASRQRSAVNTTAKLLLMACLRDPGRAAGGLAHRQLHNFASQRAIERLGAKQDGRAASPRAAPRRHGARHRDVQPGRRRMAGGQGAPALADS